MASPERPKLISEKISDIIEELEGIGEDAADIEFTGTVHKIEAAIGDLKSAQLAAEQYTAAGRGF